MTHLPGITRSTLLVVALLAGVALGPPQPLAGQAASADPANNPIRGFQRISDYVLSINGKDAPSEIYQSQSAAALLVISSALPSPILLSPAQGAAETVNLMKVDKKPDGSIDLLAGAVMALQGPIEFQGEEVGFKAEGKSALLKPTPPLLGMHRAEEVTAHNPEYLPRAAAYTPNAQAVAALKKEQRPVTVRIFFGSWCPHCREMVPHAIKLEQLLKGTTIHFEYFGLPPRFGSDSAARNNAITGVPTGIVYVAGKEVGRLIGITWSSPETTLVTILTSGKS
jgi:thiol-disulfide isomerase/thioredoxin